MPRASLATLALAAIGGFVADRMGLPAGWVAGGLLAVAAASLAGFDTDFPAALRAPVFLVLGIYSGTGVTRETLEQMQTWPASFAILARVAGRADRRLLLVAEQPLRLGAQRCAACLAAGRAFLRRWPPPKA